MLEFYGIGILEGARDKVIKLKLKFGLQRTDKKADYAFDIHIVFVGLYLTNGFRDLLDVISRCYLVKARLRIVGNQLFQFHTALVDECVADILGIDRLVKIFSRV